MHVLLVTSLDPAGHRLRDCIGACGHAVEVCADPVEAWAAWEGRRHPLAVVDTTRTTGADDLLARFRDVDEDDAPYVILVASPDSASLRAAEDPGADDVLVAPVRSDELGLRLRLAARRMGERARSREEHRSFMDLLAQAPDMILTVGLDGHLLFGNRAWYDALGYAEDELATRSFFDLIEPSQQPRAREVFRWVLRGHGIRRLQTELVARDGSVLSVEGSLTPRHVGTTPTSVRVILRDVSRRKRAETVLRNVLEGTSATTGKDFFRSLVRHLSGALGVRHALVADLVAGPRPRLRTLAVWAHGAFGPDREFALEISAAAPGQGVDERALFPGARFLEEVGAESYLGVPLKDADGSPIGLLCVLDEGPMETGPEAASILSTFAQRAGAELERLHAQERLAGNEARMRAMLDAMPDLLFRVAADGTVLSVHVQDAALLFVDPDRLPGQRLDAVLPADVAAPCMEKLRTTLASGSVQEMEYELLVARGLRQFEARLARCGPDEVLIVVRDVTSIRRAEAERRALDRRMQESQKLESLGVLAGGIAHDFNNLLTSIMGYASLAQRSSVPGSPAHRYVCDIEKASRRAADLAMQMLAYSGKGKFVIQPLDLREVVRETTAFLRTDVNSRGVVLACELPDALPTVEGDVTQMRQVVMNLVLNAAQASEREGGRVVLRVQAKPVQASAFASCYVGRGLPSGDYVRVVIEDNGCGMAPEIVERIFDPFFTTKTGGRGLGLAAVVGIVRGHRGALHVASEAGVGTTVTICFPASAKQVPPGLEVQHGAPDRGEGLILVVDDEPDLLRLTREILESGGYRVVTAANGKEGVDRYRERADEIAAVLLDMTMPVMGGVEAFQGMRAVRPGVRVLVSSGYTQQEAINRFRGDTPASFIQKPYTASDLLEKIGGVVAAGALRS